MDSSVVGFFGPYETSQKKGKKFLKEKRLSLVNLCLDKRFLVNCGMCSILCSSSGLYEDFKMDELMVFSILVHSLYVVDHILDMEWFVEYLQHFVCHDEVLHYPDTMYCSYLDEEIDMDMCRFERVA